MALTPRQEFERAVQRPEEDLDLALAALLIAKEEYPDLDPKSYLWQLDEMAARTRGSLKGEQRPQEMVRRINACLYELEGFRGNEDEYYDPRNSFLNEVLDRKLGIPITLSVVYMEVGRRIGLPLEGVGMPGHFLLKPAGPAQDWFVDAFHQGKVLTREECAQRVEAIYRGQMPFRPEFLATVTKRQVLVRMLGNLKGIYRQRRDFSRALAAIDRMLTLEPDAPEQVRDRGAALAQLGQHQQAVAALERYLSLAPTAGDAESVKDAIDALWKRMAGLN